MAWRRICYTCPKLVRKVINLSPSDYKWRKYYSSPRDCRCAVSLLIMYTTYVNIHPKTLQGHHAIIPLSAANVVRSSVRQLVCPNLRLVYLCEWRDLSKVYMDLLVSSNTLQILWCNLPFIKSGKTNIGLRNGNRTVNELLQDVEPLGRTLDLKSR